ncbi:N-acetylgalactosamine-6-O-sulfatase [Dyadobacter sp. CECT 9623]|uniref:N-acetylgalactosamine-6-O-sulfatase n=1 Tax=Dyadobacter linearis TaxID=2823330 RepID=A0ABM8UKC7_9BACT|nr:sulfatase [Dyadobacter sp. CECT 9623]CAG5067720.1 N-acetylgalactosamine-6-O-sulfatase [Dyadobacter sp. CECT 9623]
MRKYVSILILLAGLFHESYAQGAGESIVKNAGKETQTTQQKPNILFILVDDWGWTDLSSAGSKYYETPNIDRLAGQGMRFSQAYSVGPNCAPSRASLMTGKYTPRHGIYTVGTSERGETTDRKLIPVENKTVLASSFVTIAEELKNAGYSTGLIGKWQLGGKNQKADAHSQGFDHVTGGTPGTSSYFYPYNKQGKESPHEGITSGNEGEYLTDRLTDEAVKFLDSNKEKPFFLYLSYFAVHTPIEAKADIISKYKTKKGDASHNNPTYAAMIQSADEGIGRVLKQLETLNLDKNTLVVFFSDNGGMGAVTKQYPLRGSKGMLYEGGVRVPLIVKWPGKTKPGSVIDTPVIGIDFYPTFLEIAGIEKPLNEKVDGQSLVPLLIQKHAKQRDIFWHFPAYLEAYKGDKTNKDAFRTRPTSTIRSGDFKLHEFYEDGRVEMYNIREDIGETKDISKSNPAKAKELKDKLDAWKTETNAPVPSKLNPEFSAAAGK